MSGMSSLMRYIPSHLVYLVDVSGHSASFAVGMPDVVVECPPLDTDPLYDGSYQVGLACCVSVCDCLVPGLRQALVVHIIVCNVCVRVLVIVI